MARPERNNVDYFPFICSEGKKMFYLEETYGNDGFAVFVKLLRELAKTNYHYLNLSENTTIMFLSAKCKVKKETLLEIINDLVTLGKFDHPLWNENSIIWCQDFIDSIQDAYNKRNNKCITYEGLLSLLSSLDIRKLSKCTSTVPSNTQSKVKYSKEEYIYTPFYDLEIKKSNGDINYLTFVKVLFGENVYKRPMNNILKMQEQLSYEQMDSIIVLKERHGISIKEILEDMEAWRDLHKNKTVLGTFRTFVNRKINK